ncbi:LamG-like jellyroll fold domain-containing protein [Nafulsella turpanensis]|uniref:LamG-like jellyroll fold domain-containing protein n=1 Tax=Nafulsella turpanensis TaxID=1265690 RepID=UPI00037E88B8|nr:LamG-like jellyroll fold domain-containing protein [Nafulsella turpanensis]
MIAHYPFDGNSNEVLGYTFNGIVNGAVLTPGFEGNPKSGYFFDGADDFIHVGDHFDLGQEDFTISCWVKVSEFEGLTPGTSSYGGWIINKGVTIFGSPSRAGYALDARRVDGENFFVFFVGSQYNQIYSAAASGFEENEWYSLIAIKEGGLIKLFVNNQLVSSTNIPPGINTNTNIPLVFGSIDKLGNDPGGTTFFHGKIDDVRLFKKALSNEERACLIGVCNPPVINLGDDKVGCYGETVQLDAFYPNSTYTWQDGSTDSIFSVSESGQYWVKVENYCGVEMDTISIDFVSSPNIFLGEDIIRCSPGNITLDAFYPNSVYEWQDGSSASTLEVSKSGTYWVKVENFCGIKIDTISIHYTSVPTVNLGEDRVIQCLGDSFLYNVASPGLSYEWQDGSISSTFSVTKSGTYWVKVKNSCGVATDTLVVRMENHEEIKIPNVFTPNNDGVNQFFQMDERLLGAKLQVYQRTGKQVFYSDFYTNNWDGKGLSSGIYYYLIEDSCLGSFQGWVQILY